jgi:uncharacterized protein (TIGR02246 family)
MPARTPEEVQQLFATGFNAGDLDAVMELYEREASLVPQPGQLVTGIDAIRQALSDLLALFSSQPTFTLEPGKTFEVGDLALLVSRWSLIGAGSDGNALDLTGQTTDLVRRQYEGNWLYVLDNPFGVEG